MNELDQVWAWRQQQFVRMGFWHESDGLASSQVDLHDMQNLLDAGCPPATALAILSEDKQLDEH